MEKRDHKVTIDGPLVHWVKVLSLRTTMASMRSASIIARKASHGYTVEGNNEGKAEAEFIIKTSAENLVKASMLVDVAMTHVPLEWRFWPSKN